MTVNLFLDDVREAPKGFLTFRPEDLKSFFHLCRHVWEGTISFDHDMGEEYPTGYDVLTTLENWVYEGKIWTEGAPNLVIHSANPIGRDRMKQVIDSIYKKVGKLQREDN